MDTMKQLLTRITAVLILSHSICCADDAWTQFGGDTGRFEFESPINISDAPTKRWQRSLGEGMSGVVVKDEVVYATYLVPFDKEENDKKESEKNHREAIIALDAGNGATIWQYEYASGWIESQQAFGGRSRAPQATPIVCGSHVLSIGFTGILHCLDRKSGEVVWKKDVVASFDATPVQFGFSASPLRMDDRIVLLLGGNKDVTKERKEEQINGGLVCLEAKTGKTIWNVACNEASYATPVIWERSDGRQIVFVTRNRIVGVDPIRGEQLWEYMLPSVGMTNVPTPLPLDDEGLLISGQGVKGTKRLEIVRAQDGFEVSEAWTSGSQFFYCNWVRRDDVLWGCDGSLLIALDLTTGELLGRFRGYNDGNVLLCKDQLLVLHGDGHLSELSLSAAKAEVKANYAVWDQRCWTPCTPCGSYLYCRGGDQLLCLDMVGGDPRAAVVSSRIRKRLLQLGRASSAQHKDSVQQILTVFESDGKDAAWRTYSDKRTEDPDSISFAQRIELSKLANDEGLHEFAKLILQHAAEDYPKESEEANRTPSSEVTVSESGLKYLQFAIRNTADETIQAYVKGPAKHPFSYGLPFRPGKARIETWPIGTKLYRTESGISKQLLLTVKEDFAGKTVDLPRNKEGSFDASSSVPKRAW